MLQKLAVLSALFASSTAIPTPTDSALVLDKNHISLTGEINAESANKFIRALIATPVDQQTTIVINSPGGSVIDALRIQDALKLRPNHQCLAIQAASAAFMILQNCTVRLVTSYSTLMQHEAAFGLPPMQAPNLKTMFEHITRVIEIQIEKQAKRLEMSVKEFKERVHHDWWIFGEDIIKHKAADKLVAVTCETAMLNESSEVIVATPFGPMKQKVNACPVL